MKGMWLQLEMDQQIVTFKKNPFVDLVREHNIILVSTLDESKKHKAKLNKKRQHMLLIIVF